MTEFKKCPICGDLLYTVDYGDHCNPPESYNECKNIRCGKFKNNYFYYDGVTFQIGNWCFNEKNEEMLLNRELTNYEYESNLKEFYLRIRYYHKKKYGKKH